jgi:hypothetical protein
MITKRHFLLSSATAVAAAPGVTLAAVPPRLDEHAGLATWQAFVGERFEIGGRAHTLCSAHARDASGLQFSLRFEPVEGAVADSGLLGLTHRSGAALDLYLSAHDSGLRADFCRSVG